MCKNAVQNHKKTTSFRNDDRAKRMISLQYPLLHNLHFPLKAENSNTHICSHSRSGWENQQFKEPTLHKLCVYEHKALSVWMFKASSCWSTGPGFKNCLAWINVCIGHPWLSVLIIKKICTGWLNLHFWTHVDIERFLTPLSRL